jgi:AraC family transcriptional regulator
MSAETQYETEMSLLCETAGCTADATVHDTPIDFGAIKPDEVRLSSGPLGWGPLNFERRDAAPASNCLPAGSSEHLVFLSLAHGRVRCDSNGESAQYDLFPGYVAIQPASKPVSWSWDTRLTFSVMRLDPAFLDRVASDAFGLSPGDYELTPTERASDPVIANVAGVLAREALRREPGSALYAESLASMLAVHLLRNYSRRLEAEPARDADTAPAPQSRPVADALRFLQSRYASEITLNDLAEAVHLSPFHLARLFKQETGASPHQYLIELRVNAARALLDAGSGQRSLAQVASAVGFADQSHLTRHFKRRFGVSPRHLRSVPARQPSRMASARSSTHRTSGLKVAGAHFG